MTNKLLEQAILEVRKLPDERQNEAAEVLLSLVAQDPGSIHLSDEQVAELRRRLADPDDSRVSDDEVAATYRRLGA